MNYFLISVSNRENLDLCIKHCLAGFTDSINGVWAFCEINEGDYVSFLYAAKAHNLYRVVEKVAYRDADKLPPWKPITFSISRKTYYFPFRLRLKPVRRFEESLIRAEFAYVAENLLLRGGYRKTHFQADQTTLQSVSQMGKALNKNRCEELAFEAEKFTPKFTTNRSLVNPPYVFPFREVILQTAIRHYLSNVNNLRSFLEEVGIDEVEASELEVLGEKALAEGHVDIFIKQAVPIGESKSIIIEVKIGEARRADFEQVLAYLSEFGPECLGAVIVARDFVRRASEEFEEKIASVKYSISRDLSKPQTFEQILRFLKLKRAL